AFPPSSREVRIICLEHWLCRRLPTLVDPVKDKCRTDPFAKIGSVRRPDCEVGTTFNAPAGRPASWNSCAKNSIVRGVGWAGLTTVLHPVAMAGASFLAPMARAKFHGVTSRETPTGSLLSTICPRPLGDSLCDP